ncbi:MAG: hypothetical protein JWR77_1702, partial [Rhizorhabdus sp.]|nr:hypothetical protein [Rhizorhabdus sp.]
PTRWIPAFAGMTIWGGSAHKGRSGYSAAMNLWNTLRARSGAIASIVALLAWFAMLWFMFGDVL